MSLPRRFQCAFALALVFGFATAAGALSVRSMTPAEVAAASAEVVLATASIDGVSTLPGGAVVERVKLEVHETWKGDARATRELTAFVGHQGSAGFKGVPGLPRLLDGRMYLLFLPTVGARPVLPTTVGGEQGLFEVRRSARGWRFFDLAGREVMGVTPASLRFTEPEAAVPAPRMRAGEGALLRANPRHASTSVTPAAADLATTWRRLVQGVRP